MLILPLELVQLIDRYADARYANAPALSDAVTELVNDVRAALGADVTR